MAYSFAFLLFHSRKCGSWATSIVAAILLFIIEVLEFFAAEVTLPLYKTWAPFLWLAERIHQLFLWTAILFFRSHLQGWWMSLWFLLLSETLNFSQKQGYSVAPIWRNNRVFWYSLVDESLDVLKYTFFISQGMKAPWTSVEFDKFFVCFFLDKRRLRPAVYRKLKFSRKIVPLIRHVEDTGRYR